VSSEEKRFKDRAEECRRAAARAEAEGDKNAWLRLAAEWDKLAEHAANKRGLFDPYE
jgi:hypothetical protein